MWQELCRCALGFPGAIAILQVGVECYLTCANLHQAPFRHEAEMLFVYQRCVTEVLVPLSLGTKHCATPKSSLKPRGSLYPWGEPVTYAKEMVHLSFQDTVPIDVSHQSHFP